MKSSAKILTAAIAAAVGVGLNVAPSVLAAPPMEKCYGVTRAAKNDCCTSTHACAGLAKEDYQWDEWVFVPKGLCAKLANGCLAPKKVVRRR